MIRTAKVVVTTEGEDGSAAGTGYSPAPVNGKLLALYLDFSASAPATTDTTITIDSDDDHPAVTLYVKSDAKDDGWVYPVVQQTTTAGVGIENQYQSIAVAGRIKVALAGCDALTAALTVYAYIEA